MLSCQESAVSAAEQRIENEKLRSLLKMQNPESPSGVAARVIGFNPTSWVRTITLDRGSLDGVKLSTPAALQGAIVGQVVGLSPHRL